MPSIEIKARFVRPLRESDIEAIAEIYNQEVLTGTATFDTDPRTLDEIRAWLLGRGERYPSLVATDGEQIVGFAALYPWSPRKGYEDTAENTVYVHRDHRGRGLGKVLLPAVLAAGREAGLHSVIARVESSNEASLRLHREAGFKKVGTLKEVGKKFGRLLDVDLMQLIFNTKWQMLDF